MAIRRSLSTYVISIIYNNFQYCSEKKQQAKIFIKIKWTISEAKVDDQTILKLKYC